MSIEGTDVSRWQGQVDWRSVADAGLTWGAARAGKGLDPDPNFARNWSAMRGEPRLRWRGAYQWLVAGIDAARQAAFLVAHVGTLRRGEFLYLDAEELAITPEFVARWREAAEQLVGRRLAAYVGGPEEHKIALLAGVGDLPLIWPSYTSEERARRFLTRTMEAWQYGASDTTLPGIAPRFACRDRILDPAAFDRICGLGDSVTTFPFGYAQPPTMATWDELVTRRTVYRMHPEFLRRVRALMEAAAAAGVPLGIGTGWRVQPDPPPPGFAQPGNSNHEGFPAGPNSTGAVAADMVPPESLPWMERNAARFGLRTFLHVNNEGWHIQPAEIPAGRDHRSQPWVLAQFELPGDVPAPAPAPPNLEDEMAFVRKANRNAVWATNGIHRRHVTLIESVDHVKPVFGDVIIVDDDVDLTDAFGRVVGDDPGDV